MGVLLGLSRKYARSPHGTPSMWFKTILSGAKITAIGAISIKKLVALITINDSRDGKAFEVFIEKFLVPELGVGAVAQGVTRGLQSRENKGWSQPRPEKIGGRYDPQPKYMLPQFY